MKKIILIVCAFAMTLSSGCAQKDLLNKAKGVLNNAGLKTSGFTEEEASNAIKEALKKGTNSSVDNVSKLDGYYKNPDLKIPFPPDAKKAEDKLRAVGLGKECDKAIMSLNRAAETAAKEAAPIFIHAITKMTVTDAINIVKGNDNSATTYLNNKTSADLTALFKPIIKAALDKVEATKYWEPIISKYNMIPFVDKINPDLTDYTNQKALEGLFKMIAVEEKNIRSNPAARTTDLLKKVFGGK